MKKAGVEVVSYSLADMKYRHVPQWGNMGTYTWRGDVELDTSDRSDEWVDIDTGQRYHYCVTSSYLHDHSTCTRGTKCRKVSGICMNENNTIHTYIDILVLFMDALLFIMQPSPTLSVILIMT